MPSLRSYALGLLEADTLAEKLSPPPAGLTDGDLSPALLPALPARPPGLVPAGRPVKVPPLVGFSDPAQRVRLLHGWFNHELQAVELFAWGLLSLPDAPPAFRRGLITLLADEQRHAALYLERLAAHGCSPGDFPVSAYLWGKRSAMDTPLRFVSAMCLVFEGANLDHTLDAVAVARAAGDEATARALETVHREELSHVAFGYLWLRRLLPEGGDELAGWQQALDPPLRPALARGPTLHPESRRSAGLDQRWVDLLDQAR